MVLYYQCINAFLFSGYVMLLLYFLFVLCSVYVEALNYFTCSVLVYVKPFIDCDGIDFVTFCLMKR